MNRIARSAALVVLALVGTRTAKQPGPTFDAVSIRRNVSQAIAIRPDFEYFPTRFAVRYVFLRRLIAEAYAEEGRSLPLNRILGGPSWIDSAKFDIQAPSTSRLVRATNANTTWLYDPQPVLGPLRGQDRKDAAHQLQRLSPTGFNRAQHDNAHVLAWRVCPDVREVEVESEKDARLGLAPRCNCRIVRAGEAFLVDGVALPAGCSQELRGPSTGRFSSSFARIRRNYAGRGRTRSWATSAAYANAA